MWLTERTVAQESVEEALEQLLRRLETLLSNSRTLFWGELQRAEQRRLVTMGSGCPDDELPTP